MYKNIYRTKQEQLILDAISSADIITVDEIFNLFPDIDRKKIDRICHNLARKGYLYRLKRGMYLVQDQPRGAPIIKDPYKIALNLFSGYAGFSSALRIYNLIDYEPFTIFIVTYNKSKEKTLGQYLFKAVAMGDRATGMTNYRDVYISTIAKTFFDCFYRPQYAGGYSTITRALYEAKALDWPEFTGYFRLASDAMCQRTGYILDMLNNDTRIVPARTLNYFISRIKNKTLLLPTDKGKATYDKKWMIMDNLGKDNIMSWWQHG